MIDAYPVRVRVMNADRQPLWVGSQKKLFRKYAGDRQRAMAQIAKAVETYVASGVVPPVKQMQAEESGGCTLL